MELKFYVRQISSIQYIIGCLQFTKEILLVYIVYQTLTSNTILLRIT